jgi:hypothetical protein
MNRKRYLVITVIVVAAVLLAILLDGMLANHLPAITSLEAEPERVLPSGSCQIMCNATDRDDDELSYNWSVSGGEINGEGATVTWTAPSSEGSYNVTVIVTDGRGDVVTKKITIEVRANKPPNINSLIADAAWILPSGSLQVTCDASDPDDDELSYEWATDGGDISGTGPEVTWTAPEEVRIYHVTVVVSDGHGSSATDSLYISVATEQPPIIEELFVTAEHCYLKTYSWGYKVGKEQEYQIECTTEDTGVELSYDWSCEDGTISGGGSVITWTAPDEYLENTTVTVVVSDIAGNMVHKSVVFNVVSCSKCTFGC